jgi:hypothetical protein
LTIAFAIFIRLGSSFRLATNMLLTPNTWVEPFRLIFLLSDKSASVGKDCWSVFDSFVLPFVGKG